MISTPVPSLFVQWPDQEVSARAMLRPPPAQDPIDPAIIPLPHGRDADLSVLHVIAQAQGHDPSPKIASAHRRGVKSKSKKAKGKEKENAGAAKPKK